MFLGSDLRNAGHTVALPRNRYRDLPNVHFVERVNRPQHALEVSPETRGRTPGPDELQPASHEGTHAWAERLSTINHVVVVRIFDDNPASWLEESDGSAEDVLGSRDLWDVVNSSSKGLEHED